MTAISLGLVSGTNTDAAALVVAEYQEVHRDSPRDELRERWVITDARRWPVGTSPAIVASDAAVLADDLRGFPVFDQTGPGEVLAELLRTAYHERRIETRWAGRILTAGQIPTDYGLPREYVVRKFEAKLSAGRVVVAPEFPLRDALREQLTRFAGGFVKRGVAAADAEPNTLLLAAMFATLYKRFWPGYPRYLSRDGNVYASKSVSRDAY